MFNNYFILKTIKRHAVSTDLSKLETKDLPDWLEPKKTQEDEASNYTQERIPTEELFKHRRSNSDKIIQDVNYIITNTVVSFYL